MAKCGNNEGPLSFFNSTAGYAALFCKDHLPVNLTHCAQLWDTRDRVQVCQPLFIDQLAAQCARFQATDNMDKVFALMGLVVDGSHPLLRPNYAASCTTLQVFLNLTLVSMDTKESLDIMCCRGGTRQLDGWPSWVPNWSGISTLAGDVDPALLGHPKLMEGDNRFAYSLLKNYMVISNPKDKHTTWSASANIPIGRMFQPELTLSR
jgi:hypothetical protein